MTVYSGDLHCHSRYSDGSCTPAQIVDYACRAGLTHIALTDHDTLRGIGEMKLHAAGRISIIPGVECTALDIRRGNPVHLLCYFPRESVELQNLLKATLHNRRIAKLDMLRKLKGCYPLEDRDVLDLCRDNESIYEVHLMQALADMGYTNTVSGELMDSLIGKEGSCHTPVVYPDVWEVAGLLRRTGGAVVLAHPGQFHSMPLAQELCQEGLLDGIECHHPRNSPEVVREALALAETHDLLVTGGSDFHGMYAKKPHPVGSYRTDDDMLRRLLQWAPEGNPHRR